MVWVPGERLSVEKLAWPVPSRALVFHVVVGVVQLPSTNRTDPVGVLKALVKAAVNVTSWPRTDGLRLEDRVAEVAAGTTWCRAVSELPAKVTDPE